MEINLPKLKPGYFLTAILTVFIFLAFPNPQGYSLYSYSETLRDLAVIRSISQGQLVLIGPLSSLGNFHFGPAYYYLLYPFARLFNFALWSLAAASLFYSCLTILLSFFVVKKWWQNNYLACLVAGLAATSTLTIQFAKYASNPNFVPLFILLFFYSLERLITGEDRLYFNTFLLAISFGIAVQLHAVPLICLPTILFILIVRRALKLNIKQWIVFVLVALGCNSLYIYYDFTHAFINIKTLIHIGGAPNVFAPLSEHIVQYLGIWISALASSSPFFNIFLVLGPPLYIFFIVSLAALYLFFLYNHRHLNPVQPSGLQTPASVKTVLAYWLVVPSLVLLLPLGALSGLRIYYFFILSPLVFIFFGLGLYKIYLKGYRSVVYYILGFYLIMQLVQMYYYNKLV